MKAIANHRFTLQPYKGMKTRHTCPACKRKRQFARYIDIEAGEPLADHVGRCNRESNCGYHYKPAEYFRDNPEKVKRDNFITHHPIIPARPPLKTTIPEIPYQYFSGSLAAYHRNNFIQFLESVFPSEMVKLARTKYRIGTSKHWPGSTVFWQIAYDGTIRAGKVMKYDPATGKRIKHPFNHITWVHSILKLQNYHLEQCFFGEHLIAGTDQPIQVVESEKTAVISSLLMPEFIWIATGGKNGCKWTDEKIFQPLTGRTVVFWPDLNAYDDWVLKTDNLRQIADIHVSDLLERKATETDRQQGLDIADFLLRENISPKETNLHAPVTIQDDYNDSWDDEPTSIDDCPF